AADVVAAFGIPAATARTGPCEIALGSLPGAGFPQNDDGRAHRPARPALPAPHARRGAPAGRLDRQSREKTGTIRWRYRHVDDTARACSDLDIHFAPRGLDSEGPTLAREGARDRGSAVRCVASTFDAKVCR